MARTFYQNSAINPATMNFNFAHVYSNRYEMDTKAVTDGIYPGRYVLVEYDKAFEPVIKKDDGTYDYSNSYSYKIAYALAYSASGEPQAVRNVNYDNHTYSASSGQTFLTMEIETEEHVILYAENTSYNEYNVPVGVTKDTVVTVKHLNDNSYLFYRAVEGTVGEPAKFEILDIQNNGGVIYFNGQVVNISTATQSEIYGYNYAIDKAVYEGMGRGYDSTVWQKTVVNGSPKYVQIAELNTVTPTFELAIDKPAVNGQPPYFDEISSNVYYKIHETPNWGFRVKAAETYTGGAITRSNNGWEENIEQQVDYSNNITYPSDTDVSWQRNIYDIDQWFDGENEYWTTDPYVTVPGAIYFNKDGFSKEEIHYSTEKSADPNISWNGENNITIAPTGKSGRIYNGQTTSTPDIQELSMMLPALGDTIAELWNIAYGDEEVNAVNWDKNDLNNEEYDNTRETDIEWKDASASEEEKTRGLRLVDYVIGPDETYAHRTKNIDTLAGCINSVHDIMGMIIHDGNDTDHPLDLLDQETLDNLSSDYIYYVNGKYYRRGIETTLDTEYDPDELYKPINVIEYDSNDKYFYKDLTNFKRLIGEPSSEIPYYQFANEAHDMELQTGINAEFQRGRYYYTSGAGGTVTVTLEENAYDRTRNYYDLSFSGKRLIFYQADQYWLPADESMDIAEEINERHPTAEESPFLPQNSNKRYYYKYKYSKRNPDTDQIDYTTAYRGVNANEFTQWESYKYLVVDNNGNYVMLASPIFYNEIPGLGEVIDLHVRVSEVTPKLNEATPLKFYVPNMYYYKSFIGDPEDDIYDYYLDSNARKTLNRDYYLLVNDPIKVDKFYEPNKYYYDDGTDYVKDESLSYTNQQYYERLELYVEDDQTGQYRIGSLWNQELGYGDNTPAGVTLGTKQSIYRAYELPGFARNLNTIHGMLIKINALLNTDDVLTRNTDTVQGCINSLNDIIDLFGGLKPERFNIVNDKGKIVSADHAGDNWISVNIDGSARTVDITHKFTAVADTTSVNNLNGDNVSYVSADTIQLYTPKVDTKGHVVGKNTETTVLPFGFKTIATNGTDQSNPIIADSTQDILNINSGNSWIQTATDTTNDILTISHETHNMTTSTSDQNLSNDSNGQTFAIYRYSFDNAGHVTNEDNKTVTMPNGYGSISGDSGTVTAGGTSSSLTIAGDSSLISTSATNNTLTITHETHTVTPDNSSTASLSDTSTVPSIIISQYGYDGAGHITSETNTTVSGVASYGIITGDNNTSTTASASLDTVAITGDTWIGTSAANDAVTLTHKAPVAVTPTAQSDLTPSFGSTFSITDWHFDSTGHKDGSSTHTVTIPQGSLVDDNTEYSTSANVLTGINFTSSSGRIGYTHQNASTLLLTGYNSAHNIINANGTIGDAFAAIEGKFNTLEGSIGSNDSDIEALQTSVNTINNTTIPNIINNTIPGAVNSAVTTLIGGASAAFDTLKEIEDWISDGQTGVSALVTRVSNLESDINNLSGSGSGSVNSQISSAISTYDSGKNFGDIITHDVSEFESAGAASAVQGNTQSTVEDIEDTLDNYIAKIDTFIYDNSDPLDPVEMTVAQLVAYVKTLEDRIATLEGGGGGSGNEPEPQTPITPDVLIEFTQGVGSTTADFTDVLTNIGGDNNLTYSVVVDNVELDLNETTPVETEENNGDYTIIINLNDSTYEKVTWTNDGNDDTLTLIPIQVEP